MRTAARHQDDARPRGKPQAYVDADGYVYPTKRASGWPTLIFICMGFAVLGALAMMNRFQIPYQALREPLATASMPTRTAPPTAPYAPPAASGGGTQQGSTAPAHEEAIRTYNAEQHARATALQATQEAPGRAEGEAIAVDAEATAQAWLEGPISTPTPTRGIEQAAMDAAAVVVDAAFDASFQDAPECSQFVGYVAGSECHAFFLEQTATAGE